MLKGAFTNSHSFVKLLLTALTVIICFFIVLFVGLLAAVPLFGLDLSNYNEFLNLSDPLNINFLKYLQIIQSTGLFIIPSLIVALFLGEKMGSFLKLDKKPLLVVLGMALLCLLFATPIIGFTGEINAKMRLPEFLVGIEQWMKEMEDSNGNLMENFLRTNNTGALLLNLFMVGIIPGIGEELMFRGVIQRIFTDWTKNIHWGVIIASILFSAMHLQFYGFFPRFLLGMFLGYLFVWSGSLWIPILVHFIYNSFGVVLYYLYESGYISIDPGSVQTDSISVFTVIVSILLVGSLIFLIKKKSVLLTKTQNKFI